jgi:hypothetical protein
MELNFDPRTYRCICYRHLLGLQSMVFGMEGTTGIIFIIRRHLQPEVKWVIEVYIRCQKAQCW